jgi:hypothetical protein
MPKRPTPFGVCKLTGVEGRFVDSHIIPRALTKPEEPGKTFIQGGRGFRPERRASSWYDSELVIEEGEAILRDYDTWAIRELRKHRLIWGSWGASKRLSAPDFEPIPDTRYGYRRISGIDTHRLRLFFLSLLWRAAASSRYEFDEIQIPVSHLEHLTAIVRGRQLASIDFYPMSLTQISTRGPAHNQTPIAQELFIPSVEGEPEHSIPIFRFYFDGLIAHIHRGTEGGHAERRMGPAAIGFDEETLVLSTVTFEDSFQRENLKNLIGEAHERWPEIMRRLYGLPAS